MGDNERKFPWKKEGERKTPVIPGTSLKGRGSKPGQANTAEPRRNFKFNLVGTNTRTADRKEGRPRARKKREKAVNKKEEIMSASLKKSLRMGMRKERGEKV